MSLYLFVLLNVLLHQWSHFSFVCKTFNYLVRINTKLVVFIYFDDQRWCVIVIKKRLERNNSIEKNNTSFETQECQRAKSAIGRLGHNEERGTATARGSAHSQHRDSSRVLGVDHAQRHSCDHPVRCRGPDRLHKSGVPAAPGHRSRGAATVDRVPGVRMGHGELRATAVPGRVEKGFRSFVGPRPMRQESQDHQAW